MATACNDNVSGEMTKPGEPVAKPTMRKRAAHRTSAPEPETELEALRDFARRYRERIEKSPNPEAAAKAELRAMGIIDEDGDITPGFGGAVKPVKTETRRAR